MAIKRNMNLGFEAIDGDDVNVDPVGTTDGVDVGEVVEASDGAQEVGALDGEIQTVSDGIEDMLAVDEGLAEEETVYAEQIETNPTEITGDTVVTAMESLSAAVAISGVNFTKSAISFEAIGANPAQALKLGMEDYKDFFKRLWAQIKEFFRKLILGFKKIFVAVMKWTAADVSACEKLIKKVKEGGEIAAVSQKDGTIFKSTKTVIGKKLGGFLAATGHSDISGANFKTALVAVMKMSNDQGALNAFKTQAENIAKAKTKEEALAIPIPGTFKAIQTGNFAEYPADSIITSVAVTAGGLNVIYSKGEKVGETTKAKVKSEFVSGIKLDNVDGSKIIDVLYALKGHVQDNKKYFDLANKAIEAVEKAAENSLKLQEGDESAEKWARLNTKILIRIAKSGIYDTVLEQIRVNKAVLSACRTIAGGKADKEETK